MKITLDLPVEYDWLGKILEPCVEAAQQKASQAGENIAWNAGYLACALDITAQVELTFEDQKAEHEKRYPVEVRSAE